MVTIDRRLAVVALDPAVPASEDVAVGIGVGAAFHGAVIPQGVGVGIAVGRLGSRLSCLRFSSAGLRIAAAGVLSGVLSLWPCFGLAQGVQPILTALQLLGQLIATLAVVVVRIYLGVDQLA
ncbi:MAG: hypothetical protein VKK62_10605 [Synechococcaceae cyanobacterium]|nr:hypothetical protein [Synechococcaceae cyanobacterium]